MKKILDSEYDLIERFFERELGEIELKEFQIRLDKDEKFARQVALYEFALRTATEIYMPEQKAIKEQLSQELKRQLNKGSKKTKSIPIWKKSLSIAATFIALVTASWLLFQDSDAPINARNYFVNQTQLMENFEQTERGDSRHEEISNVLQAYNLRLHEKVISLTDKTEIISQQEWLIRGRSFIQLKQFEKAIIPFQKIINEGYAKRDEALWNLAHIYFELSKVEQSKFHLKLIIDEDFNSKKEAKKLLNVLD